MAGKIKTVTFTRELTDEEKIAPQARAIIESAIESHGVGTEISIEDVVAAMEGNVTTRQPLGRIFAYYAPKLEAQELITLTRSVPAPKKAKSDDAEETSDEGVADELSDETEE